MHKTVLDRFINKYNLGGSAEAVLWEVDKKSMKTRAVSDDKHVLTEVSTTEAGFDEGEYAIYNTALLRSLMGVLEEEIQVKPQITNKKVTSLQFRDASTKVVFVLANPSVIPAVPALKALPEFDLEIKLDSKFMSTFIKSKNALPEVETFTVVDNGIVLGYSKQTNTNRVSFNVDATGEMDKSISFSARYLKEILVANKEATKGMLKVSSKGLAHVTFDIQGFTADYYLVEIQTA